MSIESFEHVEKLGQSERKRVAIVGGGVSGLAALWLLDKHSPHHVELFESENRLGGHANSIYFQRKKGAWVDTAFVMLNRAGWPNFHRFLINSGIPLKPSCGTYSVSERGFSWASTSIWAYFAGPGGIFSWPKWRMMFDIIRFNWISLEVIRPRAAGAIALPEDTTGEESLGDYLSRKGFSEHFRDNYLVPLIATIRSAPPKRLLEEVSIHAVVSAMHVLDLLKLFGRVPWYAVKDGSYVFERDEGEKVLMRRREYSRWIENHTRPGCLHKGAPVAAVRRSAEGVELVMPDGQVKLFDHVILATHSPISHHLLKEGKTLSAEDERILGSRVGNEIEVIMHYDTNLLPADCSVWAAWNSFAIKEDFQGDHSQASTTFDMNLVHGLPIETYGHVLGTINPPRPVDESKVITRIRYSLPVISQGEASRRLATQTAIHDKISFAGAWTGQGTHEDGWLSGVTAAEALGATLPWQKLERAPPIPRLSLFQRFMVSVFGGW